jgi:hypothetical protein
MSEIGNDKDVLDLDQFSGEALIGTEDPVADRSRKRVVPFLKGPVPMRWLERAARLSGKALVVGIGLWHLSGLTCKTEIRATGTLWKRLGISRQAVYRGLRALEREGLISVVRHPGQNPIVTLIPE